MKTHEAEMVERKCNHGVSLSNVCPRCADATRNAILSDDPAQSYSPGAYDGGPAFPQTTDSWYRADGNAPAPSGMSIRDYFAAEAMRSMCSVSLTDKMLDSCASRAKVAAKAAYIYADEMLAERERTVSP